MEIAILLGIVLILFFPRIRAAFLKRSGALPPDESPKAVQARARVRQVKYFYIHLGFFLLTTLAALLLTLAVGNQDVAYIVAIVWGLAVLIHGFILFGINGDFMRRWEERRVEDLLHEDE